MRAVRAGGAIIHKHEYRGAEFTVPIQRIDAADKGILLKISHCDKSIYLVESAVSVRPDANSQPVVPEMLQK
jgi:hypothetical protein